jgi:hypothetical protein
MKVKLAEGRRLRDPITKMHLQPDQVRDVPGNMYWARRLRDGDVVLVDDKAAAPPQEQQPAPVPPDEKTTGEDL